jgi:hypothetical protein
MSFERAWLDLREAADRTARDPGLKRAAEAFAGGVPAPVIVDLGTGTGAMMRALAAPREAQWLLLDRDPVLLAEAERRGGGRARCLPFDLNGLADLPLAGVRLVTASALLDLASAAWIEMLADRVAVSRAGLYVTLSFDGTCQWSPVDTDDAVVMAAFNRHQRRDKGLGQALGAAGGPALADAMQRRGYVVRMAPSPWQLGRGHDDLQAALIDGIAAAAAEAGCVAAAGWRVRRTAMIDIGECRVGHLDLLALPAEEAS